MKQKDIKKRLKKEAEQFASDPLDKIKLAARADYLLPYDSDRCLKEYSQGDTVVMAKSKRKTIWLFTAFTSIIVCFILIFSCNLKIRKKKNFKK